MRYVHRGACTSSQFVHIAPDETETLARVPKALQFPAPHLPDGHVVLGYDERGHCPMLIENQCSIYSIARARCRTYNCHVFPARGSSSMRPRSTGSRTKLGGGGSVTRVQLTGPRTTTSARPPRGPSKTPRPSEKQPISRQLRWR